MSTNSSETIQQYRDYTDTVVGVGLSIITSESPRLPISHTIFVFIAIYIWINISMYTSSKIFEFGSKRNLKKLTALIESSQQKPQSVIIHPPNKSQILSNIIDGRGWRSAVTSEGKKYRVEYKNDLDKTFEAYLYTIKNGMILFFDLNVVVPIQEEK